MTIVPGTHVLSLAAVLFALGIVTLLSRRNVLFMLIAVEILLNAAGLAFVGAGSSWGQPDGQVMYMFILAVAGAEVAVGLALVLMFRERFGTLDADTAELLRDRSFEDARR